MAAAKRQNIIIGIAILAVLYGLYDVMFLSRSKSGVIKGGGKSSAELETFTTQVASDIRSVQTDVSAYVVTCAERPWVRNPFFAKARSSGSVGGFTYSGYVEANGHGIAIINQAEYRAGEELENREGYFVKEITSSRVIIENRAAKTEITVPLHE